MLTVIATLIATLLEPGVVTTPQSEYNFSESADGKLRLFARAPKGFKDAKIMVSRRGATGWSAPEPISFSDARYTDSDPFLVADGTTLYFVSNRPVPGQPAKHDLDIWRTRLVDGVWQAPEHLPDLSSPGEELGVELIGDTVYFNSTRKGGPGPLSIYAARVQGSGFAAPVALPAPVNSAGQQGDFTLSPDGRIAMFWSVRDKQPPGLYAVAREGTGWGAPKKLALPPGFAFTPSFSHDGQTLFFAIMAGQEDASVYTMPAQAVYDTLGLAR